MASFQFQVSSLMDSQKVMLLAHDAHFGIHQMLRYIPKTRPKGLKQFGISNAQHFLNLFPNVAKIARKRLYEFVKFEILRNIWEREGALES
jgi:hypothetical protein